MRLKYLLILIFILITSIPLFVGLQYINQTAGAQYRSLFEEHLSSLSLIAKKRVLATVDRIRDNTALVSSRTQMRISLNKWNQDGDPAHLVQIGKILNDAKYGLSRIKDIDVFDPQGTLVASTFAGTGREMPINVERANRKSISLEASQSDVSLVSIAPLLLNHETVGYIRLEFFSDFLTDMVRDRSGLGETGEWLVAVRDDNGDALFAVPLKYDHAAAFTRVVPKEREDVPITQALLGNERVMSHAPDYLEVPVLASTRYIPELDWGLVAKVSEKEVNSLVSRNDMLIYLAELAIIVVSILVGVGLSMFVSSPIEKLQAHTSRVAKGDLLPPPELGGWREVKELASHFAVMVQAVKEMNESLQTKVEARTRELNDANEKLEQLAMEDPLTGLNNRRVFDERFRQEFGRAKRHKHDLTVVMLDIDHFKSVNDTYGHPVGDEVLKRIAAHLKATVRASDILARLGGEEFCMVLPESPEKSCVTFLERLRSDISEMEFVTEGRTFRVTCSFGVAGLVADVVSRDVLTERSDAALYQAKQTGRNRIVRYSEISEAPAFTGEMPPN